MVTSTSNGCVIEKMELLDGTVYTEVSTASEQVDGFIGIVRKGQKPLYISKSAIKTLEFTGERW